MLFLIRLAGEIATKARPTRRQFQRALAANIGDGMRASGIEARLTTTWSRFYLETEDARAADVLARIFGIQSFSPVLRVELRTLDEVVEHGHAVFAEIVAGTRFAVRARVTKGSGDPWDFGARDIEHALGAALLPHSEGVNLSRPDVTAYVELRDNQASFFSEIVDGPKGLPLGAQERAVALVSGGFDSPVAAWYVMRRGVPLDFVFCNIGGDEHRESALEVMRILANRWSYGTRPRVHIVDFAQTVADLRANVRERFVQLVLKRQMVRAATAVAEQTGAAAIVTGDAIGQVASQTLRNLVAMEGVTDLPILRPLLGMDKEEIIAASVRIGTHDLSAAVIEHCAIVPHNPATAARRARVEAEEQNLDLGVLHQSIEDRAILQLRESAAPRTVPEPIELNQLPSDDVVVIDVRSRAAYEAWHYPGAKHEAFPDVLMKLDAFPEGPTYVAYCAFGAKSSLLAEALRRRGARAYSFEGGTRGLMEWCESNGIATPLAFEEE